MPYQLPKLDYSYDALEPHIDARTMEIHHSKHHNAYISKANAALEGTEFADKDINELISNLSAVPEKTRGGIRNNGGGHANHSLFWKVIGPGGGGNPSGDLSDAIDSELGGFAAFKKAFADAGATRFGSGWAWLIVKEDGKLAVTSTPNQDNPLMKGFVETEGTPIIGLDVWEHAYYLKYQNKRPDYIEAFWNVVNWKAAEANYQQVKS